MGYKLTCNRIPRPLHCLANLPEKIRAEFDYVEDEFSPRFVQYRGGWRDAFDTQRIEFRGNKSRLPMGWGFPVHPGEPLAYFDSVISDTYFSGLAFRFVDDDSVIVGRYYS